MQRDYVVAYHGTAQSEVPSILKEGLEPSHGRGADQWALERYRKVALNSADIRPPSVFVSLARDFAAGFAELAATETNSEPVVLRLHIPKEAFVNQFKADELSASRPRNLFEDILGLGKVVNYRTEQTIPASWIVGRASTNTNGHHLTAV